MTEAESQKSASTILGARASNAGDVFHELWALREALRLLSPKTELKAVTVEGIASGKTDYQYDGVDCGLFYGQASITKASKLELVQVKYSTADPDKPWTLARITTNTATNGNNSVLRKLADTYLNAKNDAPTSATIVIRLVSNQPLDKNLPAIIQEIVKGSRASDDAKRFIVATGLNDRTLDGFLCALDLSGLGAGSRSELKDTVNLTVSKIIEDCADTQVLTLQRRIGDLMLPGAERERITLATVLSWFAVSSLSSLFPAPADFRAATHLVQRASTLKLIETINQGSRLTCLHGSGGCGKTTSLLQVPTLLPNGSVSVIFDCYGSGRYIHSNDRRHLPENAFLQIANELAELLETPFLVAKSSSTPIDIRAFLRRVVQSAELLKAAKPEALLAILIDAADNSIAAAERSQPASACFVWELAECDFTQLPANVRIVISARTARKDKLRLVKGTPEVLCPPFNEAETADFVRLRLGMTSAAWISQFHELSNGIPRVQTYAFAKGGASQDDVLDALRPSGKKLDTVLRELLQQAAAKSGDRELYDRCVASLATLPPPIPIKHLAGVCGCSEGIVADIVADVQPTLIIDNDAVSIADEDVEDFLKDEAVDRSDSTVQTACAYFATNYRVDTYAATHYCDLLVQARQSAKILPIIENDLLPAGISDPIVRREVQFRRLRLALTACRSAGRAPDTLRVILLSAEATKDEDALQSLLENQTDLSVRFANESLTRFVLSDKDRYPKQGSILAQDAARAARDGDSFSARERLNDYIHWMRRKREVNDQTIHMWKVEVDDVVALAEAAGLLDGAEACFNSVLSWRPISLRKRAALLLIPRLLARGQSSIVTDAYERRLVPRPWSLFVTVPLALSGYKISKSELIEELSSLTRSDVPDFRDTNSYQSDGWELDFVELVVTGCEIGLNLGIDYSVLSTVLSLVIDHRKSPSPSIFRTDAAKIDISLRAWLLKQRLDEKAPTSDRYIAWVKDTNAPPPPKKRGRKKKTQISRGDSSRDELSDAVRAIYDAYTVRVELLFRSSKNDVVDESALDSTNIRKDTYYFDRDYWATPMRQRAAQSVARLMQVEGLSLPRLLKQAEAISRGQTDDAFANKILPIWREFLIRPAMHSVILTEATCRATSLFGLRTRSESKAEALTNLSRLLLNFSELDARALFEKAVEITQEIDREAVVQIDFVGNLVKCGSFPDTTARSLAADYAAIITDVAIRLENEEHVPWSNATSALAHLAPEVALAAVSQQGCSFL